MAEEVGYPFNQLPLEAFTSFQGGVEGWGSICGALIAPIQLIGMVAEGEDKSAMVMNCSLSIHSILSRNIRPGNLICPEWRSVQPFVMFP